MKLTKKLLAELEHSIRIILTPEQRVIMLYWYRKDCKYGFKEEDLVYGIRDVMRYYPDHRPKPMPDGFLKEDVLGGEPF